MLGKGTSSLKTKKVPVKKKIRTDVANELGVSGFYDRPAFRWKATPKARLLRSARNDILLPDPGILKNNRGRKGVWWRRPAQNAGLPVLLNRRVGSPSSLDYRLGACSTTLRYCPIGYGR